MPIRVIATDIDHTLIDERGQLPAVNIAALQQAADRGIHIVLATARRLEPTQDIANRLQIPTAFVCHNGARVWDDRGNEVVHHTLNRAITQRLAEIADEQRLAFIFTIDEINFYNVHSSINTSSSRSIHTAVPALQMVSAQPATRVVAQGAESADVLWNVLAHERDVQCFRYTNRNGVVYSAIAANPIATKEQALATLCETWGVARNEVLAIGDADADAGMLRWAGVGVSLKGSMPEALAAAKWVAPSARLGGVAVAIHRYVLDN